MQLQKQMIDGKIIFDRSKGKFMSKKKMVKFAEDFWEQGLRDEQREEMKKDILKKIEKLINKYIRNELKCRMKIDEEWRKKELSIYSNQYFAFTELRSFWDELKEELKNN